MAKYKTLNIAPKEKVIIITGGYGHLGGAIVNSLIENGAYVYIAARNEQKFRSFISDYSFEDNAQVNFVECDTLLSKSIDSAFKFVYRKEGRIDGLINNAYGVQGHSPLEMSRADFSATLDASLSSIFDSIKHLIPYLERGASIINVSSMYGVVAPDFKAYEKAEEYLSPPHYGAAKAGAIQLTKYFASFLGSKDIRVNSVSPGPFPSDEIQNNDQFMKELAARTLLGRFGKREELAGIFTFLMSDSAKFISGQNFIVDGGWTTR